MTAWLIITAVVGLATGYALPRPKRDRSINVIDGIVYPAPDDPRWSPGDFGSAVVLHLGPVAIKDHVYLPAIGGWRMGVGTLGDMTDWNGSRAANRYARAVVWHYQQRRILEAIEKA